MYNGFDEFLGMLGSSLMSLDLDRYSRSRAAGTALITQTVEDVAKKHGWGYEREVFIGILRPDGRRGLCDFALVKPEAKRIIIEIDSANKKWSLKKLLAAYHLGNEAIWIRWNCPMKLDVPAYVHLIDLSGKRRISSVE